RRVRARLWKDSGTPCHHQLERQGAGAAERRRSPSVAAATERRWSHRVPGCVTSEAPANGEPPRAGGRAYDREIGAASAVAGPRTTVTRRRRAIGREGNG